jgi:hypothetical protein
VLLHLGNVSDDPQMIKKIGYLAPMVVALLPIVGFIVGQETGNWLITIGLTPFALFVIVPILDGLIGRDPSNPSAAVSAELSKERYYRLLPMLCLPAYLVTLLFGAWVVANEPMPPSLCSDGSYRSDWQAVSSRLLQHTS